MVGALRLVSVERGYDPRDFALVPFGGAGPLHGADLAALLGMRTDRGAAPPRRAVDVRPARHRGAQRLRAHQSAEAARLRPRRCRAPCTPSWRDRRDAWLAAEAVPPAARRVTRLADLRYRHQGFELTVPWPERDLADRSAARALPRAPPSALHLRAARRAGRDRHAARGRAPGACGASRCPSLERRASGPAARPARRRVFFAGRRLEDVPMRASVSSSARGAVGDGSGHRRAARRHDRDPARAACHGRSRRQPRDPGGGDAAR